MGMYCTRIFKFIGFILSLIGLAGIPEDLQIWIYWLSSMNHTTINIIDTLNSNVGRWVFTALGAITILIAYKVPQIVWGGLRQAITGWGLANSGKAMVGITKNRQVMEVQFSGIHREYVIHGEPRKKEYSFDINNRSTSIEAKSVRVEVESVREFPYEGCPPSENLISLQGNRLKFSDNKTVMTFPAGHHEPIKFVSFTYAQENNKKSNIKMIVEAEDRFQYEIHRRKFKLDLKITGERIPPLLAAFSVEVTRDGNIEVIMLDQEATRL